MIVFITATETERLALEAAATRLPPNFPDVHVTSSSCLQTDEELDGFFLAGAGSQAKLFVVRILGGMMYFERGFPRLRDHCVQHRRLLLALPGDQQPDPELAALSNVPLADLTQAFEYIVAGGIDNYVHLLRYLSDIYLLTAFGFDPPRLLPVHGLYHPEAMDRLECAQLDRKEFVRRYWKPDQPGIALLFYRAHWLSSNLKAIDAIVRALEEQKCNVLPVFCYSLRDEQTQAGQVPSVFSRYLLDNGTPTIDCAISLLSYCLADLDRQERATFGTAQMSEIGVPVLQAVSTMQTEEEWRNNPAGTTPLDAAMYVVMPEFDGRLITSAVTFRESSPSDTANRMVSADDRADYVARLARRHAMLRRKLNSEKRIALVLTNFANKQGRIGSAVGLDTPASVLEMFRLAICSTLPGLRAWPNDTISRSPERRS